MDKYLQFNHLDLSEDPSFIRWAKGTEARDRQDWDGWLVNHPDKVDLVDKAKSIVLAMRFVVDKPSIGVEDKVWDKISTDINAATKPVLQEKPERSLLIKMLPYVAVAAVALILLLMNIGNEFDTSVQTPFAKVENIMLPDGSEVVVNADSKIQYDVKSWKKNRVVSLEGEGFFTVEKGSQFTVRTKNGSVHVLGTSFNVYNRNNQLSVHCETGKVSVRSAGEETILTPQQSVMVANRQHILNENVADSERRSTWRNGIFVYKAAILIDVKTELERQFGIRISMDKSLNDLLYTGSFKRSIMKTALTEVFYPLDLKFDIKGKNITITK